MQHRNLPAPASLRRELRSFSQVLLLAVATISFVPAGLAQDQVMDDYGATRVGESLFAAYCRSCHGPTAEGDGPLASSLRVKPANLALLKENNGGEFPFDRVVKKIDGTEKVEGHGSSDMPIWGKAFRKVDESPTDEAVRDKVLSLAHYVRSLQIAG